MYSFCENIRKEEGCLNLYKIYLWMLQNLRIQGRVAMFKNWPEPYLIPKGKQFHLGEGEYNVS